MNKIVEQLKEARALIANPFAWIKGEFHTTRSTGQGKEVDCFCAIGALRRVTGQLDSEAATVLASDRKVTRSKNPDYAEVITYNDKKTTTKKDILSLFDRAIKRAQKLGA